MGGGGGGGAAQCVFKGFKNQFSYLLGHSASKGSHGSFHGTF